MDRSLRKNFIIILFLSSTLIFAGKDEEFFLRGNKYYANHEYDKALDSYDMMDVKGRAVLYNMGNSFYHMDNYAKALVYWSRSQKGATPYENGIIIKNKELVYKKIGKNSSQDLRYVIKGIFNWVQLYCSLFLLQLLFLLCLCFFVIATRYIHNSYTNRCIKFLLVLMIIIMCMIGVYYRNNNQIYAIVIEKDVMIFSGPDKGFYAVSPVAYAHEVMVKESREGWHKIRYNDTIGWVEAGVIEII